MARTRRKKGAGWGLRIFGVLALAALAGAAWLWWSVQHWRPSEDAYPDQGVSVDQVAGNVNFGTVRALGGRFAYLAASEGADVKDAMFARNLTRSRAAGLQAGALHRYDPCVVADGQSANFVTMVPRGGDLLPPAVALDATGEDCEERVSEAAVESELMIFINQVEKHVGKPVVLKVGADFENRYGIASRLERQLWVSRTRFEPGYVQRPWLLWSANEALMTEAADEPLEWVVVRP